MTLNFQPSTEDFARHYDQGDIQLVHADVIADLETPVSAYMKLCAGCANSFLLESVQDGDIKGRFSIIGWAPDLVFKVENGTALINRNAAKEDDAFKEMDLSPLDGLRKILNESRFDIPAELPKMSAGVFGYLGYDMVKYMEALPDTNPTKLETPESLFIRPTLMAVFDNVTNSLKLATPVYPASDQTARQAYENAVIRLTEARQSLGREIPDDEKTADFEFEEPGSNISPEEYFEMVRKARDYIKAGDIFQVVLSQQFNMPFPLPPFSFYRSLRRINPSPYLFFLNFDGFSIVGSSPEVLVGVEQGTVNIRPIAGTRRRGNSAEEDREIGAELLTDEKELAEHLMLLDLGRNDVGRVSQTSSISINESFSLQKTSHLIHIYSDVTGKLLPDHDTVDALTAGFPAGTVSGAPKVRAMEIIDELEPQKRGIYSGCVGYFAAGGDMDTCIALRTGIIKDGMLYVQAGGGVVYDSTEKGEYDETVNKAMALFRAAKDAIDLYNKK
ncbi:MAG: anthranilate synthase component I [Parvibaculales bacterium]